MILRFLLLSMASFFNPKQDLMEYYFPLKEIKSEVVYHYRVTITNDEGFSSSSFSIHIAPIQENRYYSLVVYSEGNIPSDSTILEIVEDGIVNRESYRFVENKYYKTSVEGCTYLHQFYRDKNETCSCVNRTVMGSYEEVITVETDYIQLLNKSFVYGDGELSVSEIRIDDTILLKGDDGIIRDTKSVTQLYNAKGIGLVEMTQESDSEVVYSQLVYIRK